MNLNIRLILCFFAFFVNASNAQDPAAIVILTDFISKDLTKIHPLSVVNVLHGRINVPSNRGTHHIQHLVETGHANKNSCVMDPFWYTLKSKCGKNGIYINWPSSHIGYNGQFCSINRETKDDLLTDVKFVIEKFNSKDANLAMIIAKNENKVLQNILYFLVSALNFILIYRLGYAGFRL